MSYSFNTPIPSVGGSGIASFNPPTPSIGGTGTASFAPGASGSSFNPQMFLGEFLKGQGQNMSNQQPPKTNRSQLLQNYQPFQQQAPADFNPMQNKGLDGDTLKMLIAALRSGDGQ